MKKKLKLSILTASVILGLATTTAFAEAPAESVVAKPVPTKTQLQNIQYKTYQLSQLQEQASKLIDDFFKVNDLVLKRIDEFKETYRGTGEGLSGTGDDKTFKYQEAYNQLKQLAEKQLETFESAGQKMSDEQKKAFINQFLFVALTTKSDPLMGEEGFAVGVGGMGKAPLAMLEDDIAARARVVSDRHIFERYLQILKKRADKATELIKKQTDLAADIEKESEKYTLTNLPVTLDAITPLVNKDKVKALNYNINATTRELFKNLTLNTATNHQNTLRYVDGLGTRSWANIQINDLSHTTDNCNCKDLGIANNKGRLFALNFGYQQVLNTTKLGGYLSLGNQRSDAPDNLLSINHKIAQGTLYLNSYLPSVPSLYFTSALTFGLNQNKAQIDKRFGGDSVKFNNNMTDLILNTYYKYNVSKDFTITPKVAFQYTTVSGVKAKLGEFNIDLAPLKTKQLDASVDFRLNTDDRFISYVTLGASRVNFNQKVNLPNFDIIKPSDIDIIHQSAMKDTRIYSTLGVKGDLDAFNFSFEVNFDKYTKSKLKGRSVNLNVGYGF